MKMQPGGYGVFRWGDVDPSGLSSELALAQKMLREGDIEGEVRDDKGNVVFRYQPKKPLAQRIKDAEERVRKAEWRLREATAEESHAKHCLARLLRLEQERAAQPQPEGLSLFAPKAGEP